MQLGVATELALAGALDKGDLDPLFVNPLPAQDHVLGALDNLGFRFKKADLERGTLHGSQMPFFQEIEYYAGHEYARHFNELELTFIAGPHALDVILEADKRGGFMSSSHDSYNRFTVRYNDQPGPGGAVAPRRPPGHGPEARLVLTLSPSARPRPGRRHQATRGVGCGEAPLPRWDDPRRKVFGWVKGLPRSSMEYDPGPDLR